MNKTLPAIFLTLGISWVLAGAYYLLGGRIASPYFTVFALVYMWVPGLIALWFARREGSPLLRFGPLNRFWLIAWLLPLGLVLLSIPVNALFGPWLGFEGITKSLPAGVPVGALPPAPVLALILAVQSLLAGATINLLFAMGEELMWRGYLWERLKIQGFWKAALIIGLIWGIWHWPLIVQGYNYPQHPLLGVLWMIFFTLLLTPWMLYLREKAGSVWPAGIFHGVINASGALPSLLIERTHDLLIGFLAVGGFVVLIAANVVLMVLLRKETPSTPGSMVAQ